MVTRSTDTLIYQLRRCKQRITRAVLCANVYAAFATFFAPTAAAHVSAEAGVTIETPGIIQKTADLEFGRILTDGSSGIVTIAPNGAVTYSGGVSGAGGTPHASAFVLATRVVDVVTLRSPLGSTRVNLRHLQDPTSRLVLSNFTTDLRNGIYVFTRSVTFHVGGTLVVPANQRAGSYVGTFQVIVDMP
jgi:hypothetical protein